MSTATPHPSITLSTCMYFSNKRCHIAFSMASIYCTVQMATVIYSTKQYMLVQRTSICEYTVDIMLYAHIYMDIFLALQRETPKLSLPDFLLDVDQNHF